MEHIQSPFQGRTLLAATLAVDTIQSGSQARAGIADHRLQVGERLQSLGPGGPLAVRRPSTQQHRQTGRFDRHQSGLAVEEDLVGGQRAGQGLRVAVENGQHAAGPPLGSREPVADGGASGTAGGRQQEEQDVFDNDADHR